MCHSFLSITAFLNRCILGRFALFCSAFSSPVSLAFQSRSQYISLLLIVFDFLLLYLFLRSRLAAATTGQTTDVSILLSLPLPSLPPLPQTTHVYNHAIPIYQMPIQSQLQSHSEALSNTHSYAERPHKPPPSDTQQRKSSYIVYGDLSSPLLPFTIHYPP